MFPVDLLTIVLRDVVAVITIGLAFRWGLVDPVMTSEHSVVHISVVNIHFIQADARAKTHHWTVLHEGHFSVKC